MVYKLGEDELHRAPLVALSSVDCHLMSLEAFILLLLKPLT